MISRHCVPSHLQTSQRISLLCEEEEDLEEGWGQAEVEQAEEWEEVEELG